jgi:peptidoglycan hydrolase CwlO-like protein
LRRAFEQTEEKLRELSQEKLNLQNAIAIGKPTESATAKLIELSKKYRDQTAEMEVLKTKCKNLEATLAIKEDELEHQKELQRLVKSEDFRDGKFLLFVNKVNKIYLFYFLLH